MAQALPGRRLRPHVKAHKCTELAKVQASMGHDGFTCATVREVSGMVAAGLGSDLLLANEVLDPTRLAVLGDLIRQEQVRVAIAVDSEETVQAAAAGGIREVLVDVNVGLPRCGCDPLDAAMIASLARDRDLEVRGVMGYEGHAVGIEDRTVRQAETDKSMAMLVSAHAEVGGEVVSAGGTGTYDINTCATEIQAGSYALMDTAYAKLDLPFLNALTLISSVISVSSRGWAVCDAGLKALGMDHGNPTISGREVWYCSDEHCTFSADPEREGTLPRVGARVRLIPAHVDPTVAYHDAMYLVSGHDLEDEVIETWPVDLRGW